MKQEGKTIGETHVKKSRSWLDRHILTDPFSDIPLNEISEILSYTTNSTGWEVSKIEKEIMSGNHKDYKKAYHKAIKERLMITIPQAETAQRETLTALLISFFACTGCRVGEVRAMR
ncbi:MAG: hypothetical protein PF518_16070 [Spirochaetaceae bacterium]|nr:hypothetical protein [Spirochaetaceae bacterium]